MIEITHGDIGNPPRYCTVVLVCLYTLYIYIYLYSSISVYS